MKEKISSMAIVIVKDSLNVLLLNNEGEWVFPKGHVEENEDFIDTAIRELKEESGILVHRNECLGQIDEFKFYFDGENAMKVIKVFAFLVNELQDINYSKQEGFIDGKWFNSEDAINYLTHDDARNALKKALNKIKNTTL